MTQTTVKGTSLSLWACLWVYPNILFFLLMDTLLVSLPISIWKFISTELWARALSLVTDLVARFSALTATTQSQWFMSVYGKNHYSIVISLQLIKINENKKQKNPISISGQELKSCFKLLQAEATWEHFGQMSKYCHVLSLKSTKLNIDPIVILCNTNIIRMRGQVNVVKELVMVNR